MGKTPEKQLEYAKKYLGKLEEIKLRVPKGEKDKIKEYAETKGESMNGFIIRAISEAMQRDNEGREKASDNRF